jgi:agmatine/peptidylarginine deiminase
MTIRIPAEWEPHASCWMAWAIHREWGKAVHKVKRELSAVVRTISLFEPVRLLAPRGLAAREARQEFFACSNVTVVEAPVDDIWMRDIAPTFALRRRGTGQEVVAIDWNFNGWGATEARPPRLGDRLAKCSASIFGVSRIQAGFVAEGGAFATDGRGTLVTTRSCLLNPSRNPVRSDKDRQRMIETELRKLPHLQACRRDAVDHGPIPENRQIETVTVEGDQLGTQLADLINKVANQLGRGTLPNVRCPERINTPAFWLTTSHQGTNANDLM